MPLIWNPSTPRVIGVEHLDAGYRGLPIDGNVNGWRAVRFRAKETARVDQLELYADAGTQSIAAALGINPYDGLRRPIYAEIVPAGSEAWFGQSITYKCAWDKVGGVVFTGNFVNENGTAVDANRLHTFGDGFYVVGLSNASAVRAQFGETAGPDPAAFPLTSQVFNVVLQIGANAPTHLDFYNTSLLFHAHYDLPLFSGDPVFLQLQTAEVKDDSGAAAGRWSHWTAQNIRDFAVGGPRSVRLAVTGGAGNWKLDYVAITVFYCPERRVAVGFPMPDGSFKWCSAQMRKPDDTTGPVLTAGQDYTLMVRRIMSGLDSPEQVTFGWRHLRGFPQDPNWQARGIVTQPVGVGGIEARSLKDTEEGMATVKIIATTAAPTGVRSHSQPYNLSRSGHVDSTKSLTQTVTVGVGNTETYGQTMASVGWRTSAQPPEGPIFVEVRRESDNALMFSAVSHTAAEVALLPNTAPVNNVDDQQATFKRVQFRHPSDEDKQLAAGKYEITFSSPGTSPERQWRVACLISGTPGTPDQTFGGNATSEAWADGAFDTNPLTGTSSEVFSSDAQVVLASVPPEPTGVMAAIASQALTRVGVCLHGQSDCTTCGPVALTFVKLSWDTHPVTGIVGYQIDRADTIEPDFSRIATNWGRTNTTFSDLETNFGVETRYRIRAVRDDGIVGDWSTEVTATVEAESTEGCCGALVFTSNAASGLSAAYPEAWDSNEISRGFTFLEASDTSFSAIYGRDKQVAFRPLERRGITFSRTVLLNGGCAPPCPSMDLFQPLRDLAWAAVPYICVRDNECNRWFAALEVPDGVCIRPGERWFAELTVTEVAAEPFVVESGTAPPGFQAPE